MKDVATLVSGVDYKIRKLIEHHELLLAENNNYITEVRVLKLANQEQKQKIKQLEENIKLLKLSKTLENKEGNVEAKLKINELVREIDKCIGLLNT
jgi:hypothetical protein